MGGSLTRVELEGKVKAIGKQLWVHDELCDDCHNCQKPFTLVRRRHHCRICGNIYCRQCSNMSCEASNRAENVRVCILCVAEYEEESKTRTTSFNFESLSKAGTVVEVQYETDGEWVVGVVANGDFVEDIPHVGFLRKLEDDSHEFMLWPLEAYFIALKRVRVPHSPYPDGEEGVKEEEVVLDSQSDRSDDEGDGKKVEDMTVPELVAALRKCIAEEEREMTS
uniref:FYVE-type domain-containing protein n=1 Tax=Palpitomonas bilix TaxID=652834 RepID=A0A7S3G4W1_9EUKA|mmetsp:Transcript_2200/g.4535  ORF Transcript_2200/g.4535 Transcript_2200/m.4535 type:complete len:223 (+) Transcript_2200:29-697(+)